MKILLHNLVAHPIAGVCWWLGLGRLGDRVHEWWSGAMEPSEPTDWEARSDYKRIEGTPVEGLVPSDAPGLPVECVIHGMIQCGQCWHWRPAGDECGSPVCKGGE